MGEQKTSGRMMLLFGRLKLYLAMVSLQFGYAGMYIITMVSLKRGMSNYVFVVYRHATATLVIAPFALILERKTRPKMTLSVFLKIIALGFLEPVLDQNLYFLGMKNTSATLASAMVNALPAVTFILAVIFRLEKVNLKKMNGLAKVIGTVVTLTGATVMTLYKGPIVDIIWYTRSSPSRHHHVAATSSDQHWAMGTVMLLCSIGAWSAFFILQSITLKQYPAALTVTALVCLMGMVEGGAAALAMERDMSAWVVGFDSRLLAAVYSGVVCSGLAYYVQGFVNKARGPVFVTAFSPLCMIITGVLGAIVLAEKVHLGSLIGAFIIVFGLYSVVWGKSKDHLASESALTNDEKGGAYELPVVINGDRSTSIADNHTRDHGPATTASKFPEKNPPAQEP